MHVAWDDQLAGYDFGSGHPLAPVRVELTIELARAFGVFAAAGVSVERPVPATDEQLETVHLRQYIAAVRQAGGPEPDASGAGFRPGHRGQPGIRGHARRVGAGGRCHPGRRPGSVDGGAARREHRRRPASRDARQRERILRVQRPGDRYHLAAPAGAERIAYVDVDVHHADGVQAAFYDDPRVLTISLHEHPATLWPGTGLPSETGGPGAEGSAVNVALPAGTGDAGWLRAFDAVVPPLLRVFRPQILVSQHGCDTHWLDPLAGLRLSIDAQRVAHAAIHQLAHEVAGGRWLLTGGGGYELLEVVPRTWTHLLAEAAGCPIDPRARIPASWREYAFRRTGREAPE